MQLGGDRLHYFEERLGNLHPLPDFLVQHRVLDGDCGLRGEGLEQLLVLGSKAAGVLIEELKDSDDPVSGVRHGHAENASRRVTGALIDFAIKTRIGVSIGNVDDLTGKGYLPGNTSSQRNPYFGDTGSLGYF